MLNYNGCTFIEENNNIVIENLRDFNAVHIFECGQCFRWRKGKDGSYTGVVKGKVANIRQEGTKLIIGNSTRQDFESLWYGYLDLGRDYSAIKAKLCKDAVMKEAVEFGQGIRILGQDIWETLISFIISANNMIPRIMKTVGAIADAYGDELIYNGQAYYSFPDAEKLSEQNSGQLEFSGAGFRCKYIVNTSRMVKAGEVKLEGLRKVDTAFARSELIRFPGVGNKVADCTLLYSGTKYDVFPTDVWVKRVMEELYFKREASFKEIQEFAADYFGELAGFAQQYLFYYARENRIGAK